MKLNLFKSFLIASLTLMVPKYGNAAMFADCGPGWVMTTSTSIDGVSTQKCEKLWCRDLETNKPMGVGNKANSGYSLTTNPVTVESLDANGNTLSIECFGERKWCSGETAGLWNAEYGAYTKRGEDSTLFISVLRGDCFSWGSTTSGEAGCKDGQTPVLVNGKWNCSSRKTGSSAGSIGKKSVTQGVFHRSATLKKIK